MKKEEIHLGDTYRILFGQAPPIFLLEVVIRTLLVFIFLLFTVRWLGKRMSGQLTIMEMTVMLTLGAIVSVGMQTPERGIGLSMLILVTTLIFHRGLGKWGFKDARIEELMQGKMSLLVKDGVIQLNEMEHCRISRQQLFAHLRTSEIYSLGKVKRAYLEACGLFSVFQTEETKPGLPILPPDDQQLFNNKLHVQMIACINCGTIKQKLEEKSDCKNCGCQECMAAVL